MVRVEKDWKIVIIIVSKFILQNPLDYNVNSFYKPALCLFDFSIIHIYLTAKYDGLPRRFFIEANVPGKIYLISSFGVN